MATANQTQSNYANIKRLNAIGVALSAEKDHNRLLEMILTSARELTQADAGTLYKVDADRQHLRFVIVHNDTLKVYLGGQGQPVEGFAPIPLVLEDGSPNERMIAAWSVIHKTTARIKDAYSEAGFDFSGTKKFDAHSGYKSKSFLTVPLLNHEGEAMAALQLLNKLDSQGQAVEFTAADQELAESLASQAAIALNNRVLIDDLSKLFDSFTQVIANAIDAKSPHTGAHCRRVPDATLMLAEAANGLDFPGLEGFTLTDADRYELTTAAWLHDCGKIVTPNHVMEKATKLESLCDRVNFIADRFTVLQRDLKIALLEEELAAARLGEQLQPERYLLYTTQLKQIQDDLEFLRKSNTGGEFMRPEDLARIELLSKIQFNDLHGEAQLLLQPDEAANLSIARGTLNPEERAIMEGHMTHTLNMLKQLHFPKHLQRVPEYAGGHHERMDGKGYPRGLTKEQMSIPARIMGIADVFEALTAHERPYKKPMPLSQTLNIMGNMAAEGHLDADLFTLFVYKKVYLDYAIKHLRPEQLDKIKIEQLPGIKQDAIAQFDARS